MTLQMGLPVRASSATNRPSKVATKILPFHAARPRVLTLRFVDAHQHRARSDVLALVDRDLADPTIDARRNVVPRRVHFALHQQRLRPHKVPYRQASNGGDHHTDNDRRKPGG